VGEEGVPRDWAIPRADDLYDTHLEELRAEGLLDDET